MVAWLTEKQKEIAKQNGLTHKIVWLRIYRYNWTKTKAITTPVQKPKEMEYAVYKGEDLLVIGTVEECAEHLGVKPSTIKFYATPSYQKRMVTLHKKPRNYKIAIPIEDED